MSRRNPYTPKYGRCTPELRAAARIIYQTWDEALKQYAHRDGDVIPLELKDDKTPINQYSLVANICAWVEQMGGEWQNQWMAVLERVRTKPFLKYGWKTTLPNIAWLFMVSRQGGQRNIERVLQGNWDWIANRTPSWETDMV